VQSVCPVSRNVPYRSVYDTDENMGHKLVIVGTVSLALMAIPSLSSQIVDTTKPTLALAAHVDLVVLRCRDGAERTPRFIALAH
jgi:hypothetical protein